MRSSVVPLPAQAAETPLLFTSTHRELHVAHLGAPIQLPARGGHLRDSALQRAVEQAFRQPAAGGRVPLVVGAIPFDLREPCCLYAARDYEWRPRPAVAEAPSQQVPRLIAQHSLPDESGFKRSVEQAIVNFRHSEIRKAVLSVARELHFAETVDVVRMIAAVENAV